MIRLLYFMGLVDAIGHSQEEVVLPDAVRDVKGLVAWLEQQGERYQKALEGGAVVQITINKRFVELDTAIRDGDEIAFFPVVK